MIYLSERTRVVWEIERNGLGYAPGIFIVAIIAFCITLYVLLGGRVGSFSFFLNSRL